MDGLQNETKLSEESAAQLQEPLCAGDQRHR